MDGRVIFMGTPDFAVPTLRMLAEHGATNNLMVVTQPDRPSGRGRRLQPPPVKSAAIEQGLDAVQVETLRNPAVREQLSTFSPDLIVVAAFGLLLPRWVLELPRFGCVNLHASLLPRFRGASPIPAAIACGDNVSGISLMQMERGLDTGAVYATREEIIRPHDTTADLTARLSDVSAELLHLHLNQLLREEITPVPQSGEIVETRKVLKAHGAIDWSLGTAVVERHVRAMWPWPRAWTVSREGIRLQVHEASVVDRPSTNEPGTIVNDHGEVLVSADEGYVRLERVQFPGKPAQPAQHLSQHPALAHGTRLGRGDDFVTPEPWIVADGIAS